jgi:hypothetical protein
MEQKNSAEWIIAGERESIDLTFLYQDKSAITQSLERLGLPHPQRYEFSPSHLDIGKISILFENGRRYFCRLVPHNPRKARPYRMAICSTAELTDFLEGNDLTAYRELHLGEKGIVIYTGGIIASDLQLGVPGSLVVELVAGDGPVLFHGSGNPLQARRNSSGVLQYHRPPSFPIEQNIIAEALQLIGGVSHPFPGYYEFEVWERNHNKVLFRNYQPPNSAYAKL